MLALVALLVLGQASVDVSDFQLLPSLEITMRATDISSTMGRLSLFDSLS